MKWEKVGTTDGYDETHRLKVPNGWLYRNIFGIDMSTFNGLAPTSWHVTVVFVPAEPVERG